MAEQQHRQPEQPQRGAQRAGAKAHEEAEQSMAEAGGDMMREGGRTMRRSGAVAQRGLEAAGEAARRGGEALGEDARHIAETAAEQIERIGETLARASRTAAENARLFMNFQSGNGFREWQQAASGLAERVFETNLRAAQEVFERTNPAEMLSMQQRFLRDYLQTVSTGSRQLFQAAQHLAEEAARPMEPMQMRQRNGGGGRRYATVADVMSREVRLAKPDDTVQEVARLMDEEDTGVLPVQDGERLVGMVTDRDIAIRLAAAGKDPSKTRVRDVMTAEVKYCFEDEDLEHVAENMAEQQVRRLPVVNRQKRLVGIISLGDVATRRPPHLAGRALAGVSQHGGQHTQHLEERPHSRH